MSPSSHNYICLTYKFKSECPSNVFLYMSFLTKIVQKTFLFIYFIYFLLPQIFAMDKHKFNVYYIDSSESHVINKNDKSGITNTFSFKISWWHTSDSYKTNDHDEKVLQQLYRLKDDLWILIHHRHSLSFSLTVKPQQGTNGLDFQQQYQGSLKS